MAGAPDMEAWIAFGGKVEEKARKDGRAQDKFFITPAGPGSSQLHRGAVRCAF
jgi:hypothetical protein